MQNLVTKQAKAAIFNIKQLDRSLEPLKRVLERAKNGAKLLSIELVPSTKLNLDALKKLNLNFCSVTWHHTKRMQLDALEVDTVPALKFSQRLLDQGHNVMLHLAGRYMKKKEALNVLEEAKRIGVRTIFALQGERVGEMEKTGIAYDFPFAADLVRFIRENFGDYFSVAVAGYAACHPESKSKAKDLEFLKAKVTAGADFIITQALFDFKAYKQFALDCQNAGINVPILPGIWLFSTYKNLQNCAYFCKTEVPADIYKSVEELQNNSNELKRFSLAFTNKLSEELLEEDSVPGVHFYTLNDLQFVHEAFTNMNLRVSSAQ